MNPWLIVLLVLICIYALMRIVAELSAKAKTDNTDNPYLDPAYVSMLPEGMRPYAEHMPEKPARKGSFYEKVWKRGIDSLLSFFGLVILSPLFLVICIAIKIDDPGPVFFTQKRIGKGKTFFSLHKFRSMKMCTPHDVPTHMLENPDQYITRVGKFLRKSSLDELPQIWDIFKGRMCIVGPRPALWNQADLIAEREKYAANDVVPGLTGWAQINGRDELEIVDKAKLDGDYVAKLNAGTFKAFAMDCRCFVGTILAVFRREGVVEGGTGEMHREMAKTDATEGTVGK